MKNLTVKSKLILLGVVAVLSLGLTAGLNYYSQSYEKSLYSMLTNIDHARMDILTLRKEEKDFLLRQDEGYFRAFEASFEDLEKTVQTIRSQADEHGMPSQSLAEANELVLLYQTSFREIAQEMKRLGLSEDQGLRGVFLAEIHEAKALLKQNHSNELVIATLTLEALEQDFLIHKEWPIVESFNQQWTLFSKAIAANPALNPKVKGEFQHVFGAYVTGFNAVAEGYRKIGLDEKSGMLGVLRDRIHQAEVQLEEAETEITGEVVGLIATVTFLIAVLSVALVLAIVLFVTLLTRSILGLVSQLLNDLGQATDQVHEASGQISEGAQQLSSGATEQAASLEEISSSMEQIASQASGNTSSSEGTAKAVVEMAEMVKQAQANSRNAAKQAGEAKQSSLKGTEAMGQISLNMSQIQKTSEKVADIIDVINDITHQTKMLATNAAIEAARAGEQGKGFAVVADEVSKLAETSKASAKEIGSLIRESTAKTLEGSQLVEQGNKVLLSILDNAEQVADLVEGISGFSDQLAIKAEDINGLVANILTASKEQAAGTEQVTQAIVQMDQVTQGSAANAEESAAAAEELNGQAESLRSLVQDMAKQFGVAQTKTDRPAAQQSLRVVHRSSKKGGNSEQKATPAPQLLGGVVKGRVAGSRYDDAFGDF